MNISISAVARDRLFSKAFRRVRPRLQPFFDAFAGVALVNPIHDSLFVGLTDAQGRDFLEIIANKDGVFQVMLGIPPEQSDGKLIFLIFDALEKAIQACPFSTSDRKLLLDALANFRSK